MSEDAKRNLQLHIDATTTRVVSVFGQYGFHPPPEAIDAVRMVIGAALTTAAKLGWLTPKQQPPPRSTFHSDEHPTLPARPSNMPPRKPKPD